MTVDHRTSYLGSVRGFISFFAYPLQSLASVPQSTIDWLNQSMTSQQSLLDQNAGIRKENLLLKAQLQRFTSLQSENMRLRSLLQSSRKLSDDMLIAETIAVDMDPYQRKIVVNKGSSQGVYKGQPIVDAYGVMGQINEPGILASTAILITDPSHAIPVQINRNGLRAVAYGTGTADVLSIPYLPNNADIKVGDLLVSSGLGDLFPEGYPVAIISSVSRNIGQPFANIKAKPEAHLERSREVLLILKKQTKEKTHLYQPEAEQKTTQKNKQEKEVD
jgi:rod shape-determining protein MreC